MKIIQIDCMSKDHFPLGLAGVPVAASKISDLDGEKGILKYRGYSIEQLAENSNFAESAYLLIYGELPDQNEYDRFIYDLRHHRRLKYKIIDLIKHLPENGHPMDATQAGIAVLGMFYPFKSKDFTDPHIQRIAITRLIAKLPTFVAAYDRMRYGNLAISPKDELGQAANFLYMLNETIPPEDKARVLDQALILHMEHTMNASTFSARVTASTLSDPFTVISSAIGTLTGPLHGGANERVLLMLEEIGDKKNVEKYLTEKLAKKEKIMGFGHREYKVKDPRAKILQKLAERLFDEYGLNPLYDTALEVEKVMKKLVGDKGIYPNVDFYSGLVYNKLGIRTDIFTPIFAMARVVGWLAHWIEQVANNRIYRPAAIYEGHKHQEYIPIHQRK